MTTMDADTAHDNDEAQQPPIGTLEHLDPHDLELDDNVRDDAAIDAEFAAASRSTACSFPSSPCAAPTASCGCAPGSAAPWRPDKPACPPCRCTCARPATATTRPSRCSASPSRSWKTTTARSLTEAQRAKGIQQMLDAGASVTKVARKLSVHRDTVKAAATAAGSAAAMDALGSGQLSLPEAAALDRVRGRPGRRRRTGAGGRQRALRPHARRDPPTPRIRAGLPGGGRRLHRPGLHRAHRLPRLERHHPRWPAVSAHRGRCGGHRRGCHRPGPLGGVPQRGHGLRRQGHRRAGRRRRHRLVLPPQRHRDSPRTASATPTR